MRDKDQFDTADDVYRESCQFLLMMLRTTLTWLPPPENGQAARQFNEWMTELYDLEARLREHDPNYPWS